MNEGISDTYKLMSGIKKLAISMEIASHLVKKLYFEFPNHFSQFVSLIG